jgi:uncharacterized paraquat-inducible protein A
MYREGGQAFDRRENGSNSSGSGPCADLKCAPMSRLVSRILLSIFMFPLAGIFYVLVAVVGEQTLRNLGSSYRDRESTMFLTAGVLTWAFVALYWCLLWRTGVQWTRGRIVGTLVSAGGAIVAGVFAAALCASVLSVGDGWGFGAFIGSIVAIMLWLIATIFLWRETAGERAQRVTASTKSAITCPTCGYNLTGLTESRCPECGSRFTLDELLALQQQLKTEVEIE